MRNTRITHSDNFSNFITNAIQQPPHIDTRTKDILIDFLDSTLNKITMIIWICNENGHTHAQTHAKNQPAQSTCDSEFDQHVNWKLKVAPKFGLGPNSKPKNKNLLLITDKVDDYEIDEWRLFVDVYFLSSPFSIIIHWCMYIFWMEAP